MFIENLVQFPGLGIELDVSRVAFTVFGIPIYWYGVCIGLGVMLALLFAFTQCNRFGIDGERMVDVVFVGLLLGVIGARVYYVVFVDGQYNTFWDLIALRSGGMAIYGGIIGGFVGAALACRWRKVPLLPMMDLTGMGFLIGQACGRWGNFFNQEAFGSNTTLPWGMISPSTTAYLAAVQSKLAAEGMTVDPNMPVHPTFLYESLWCALGFLLLFLYRKRRKFNGELFLMYVMWYGLGRAFIEGLRTDSLMLGSTGLRTSQVLAALSVVAAFTLWVIARVRTAGKPLVVPDIPPHVEQVTLQTDDGTHKVFIEWPANTKAPNKAQREELARAQWEQEQAGRGDGGDKEDGGGREPRDSGAGEPKADIATGDAKQAPSPAEGDETPGKGGSSPADED